MLHCTALYIVLCCTTMVHMYNDPLGSTRGHEELPLSKVSLMNGAPVTTPVIHGHYYCTSCRDGALHSLLDDLPARRVFATACLYRSVPLRLSARQK